MKSDKSAKIQMISYKKKNIIVYTSHSTKEFLHFSINLFAAKVIIKLDTVAFFLMKRNSRTLKQTERSGEQYTVGKNQEQHEKMMTEWEVVFHPVCLS